ncbi:MAG: hypothetical protein U1E04_09360 [Hylemonella sp.]|nr:hypothetical protein [Hylemonella sp.]MDZ4074939.1 hypothetical protein [Hylemonella sp.]
MDFIFFLMLAPVIGYQFLKVREQRRRIYLLGGYLSQYQIEKLMENVTEGYLRALGEDDEARRAQIWGMLGTAEVELNSQFQRFATDFSKVWNGQTQVSTLGFAFPYADKLLPRQSFDMRHLLAIHAEGIAAAAENRGQLPLRDKAFTMSAELFLMQHSCHWFCRSRAIASARLQARHQTSHAQVLAAVSPATREAYRKLTGV